MGLIQGSVPVTGFIAPKDSADQYYVTDPIFSIGGFRTVDDLTARDAIYALRRRIGMFVYVRSEDKIYYLKGGILNTNWTSFDLNYVPYTGAVADLNLGTHTLIAGAVNPTNLDTDIFVHYDGSKLVSGNIYQHTNGHIGMFDVPSDDYDLYVDGTAAFANNVTFNLNAIVKGNVRTDDYGDASQWNDAYNMSFVTGWDLQQPTQNGVLSWDNATQKLTIGIGTQPNFIFWINTVKFTKTADESIILPNVTGVYYIYYNNTGTLQSILEVSMTDAIVYNSAFVASVFWNATAGFGLVRNAQHGVRMDSSTYMTIHESIGATYISGLNIGGLSDGGTTFSQINSGVIRDEDIRHIIPLQTAVKPLYKLGTAGEWTLGTASNEVGLNIGGTYGVWNSFDGTTWALTEGDTTTDFFIHFYVVLPTFNNDSVYKVISQNAYSTRNAARDAIPTELAKINDEGLPANEVVWLYATIVKRNGKLQTIDGTALIFDLRKVQGTGGGSAVSQVAADIQTDVSDFGTVIGIGDTDVQLALKSININAVPYIGALNDFDIGEHMFSGRMIQASDNGITISFKISEEATLDFARAEFEIGSTLDDGITDARLFVVPNVSSAVQIPTGIEVRTNPINTTAEKRFRMEQLPTLARILSSSNNGNATDPGTPWMLYVNPNINQLYLDTNGNVGIGKIPDADTKFDVDGNIKADKIIKKDGLPTQFLKADGSTDITPAQEADTSVLDAWEAYVIADGGTVETWYSIYDAIAIPIESFGLAAFDKEQFKVSEGVVRNKIVERNFSVQDVSNTVLMDFYEDYSNITEMVLKNIDSVQYSLDNVSFNDITFPFTVKGTIYWKMVFSSGATLAFLKIKGELV